MAAVVVVNQGTYSCLRVHAVYTNVSLASHPKDMTIMPPRQLIAEKVGREAHQGIILCNSGHARSHFGTIDRPADRVFRSRCLPIVPISMC